MKAPRGEEGAPAMTAVAPAPAQLAGSRDPAPDLEARAARGLLIQGGAFAGRAAASFAVQVAVACLISPGGFGLFAFSLIALDILAAVANLHLGVFHLQRRSPRAEAGLPFLLLAQLAVSAVAVLLGEVALVPALRALGPDGVGAPLALLLPAAILVPQNFLLRSAFERRLEYGRACLPGLVGVVAQAATSIPLALHGWEAMALAAGYLAREALELIVLLALALPRLERRWEPVPSGEIFRFALPLLGAGALAALYWHLDDALAALLLGPLALGLYHVAFRFPHHLFALNAPLVSNALGVFARLADDGPRLRAAFESFTRLSGYLHLPAGALGVVLARPFMDLLGPAWGPAGVPLAILFGLVAFRGPLAFWAPLHQSRGLTMSQLPASAATCLILMGLGPPLANALGIAGVAAAVAAAIGFELAVLAPRYVRRVLPGMRLWRPLAGPALVAALNILAGAAARALGLASSWVGLAGAAALVLVLDVGLAAYLERARIQAAWRRVRG